MRPSEYRYAGYKRSIKQNNFYDGRLRLSELSTIPDKLSPQHLYRAQKEGALNYHITLANTRFLSGLNYDLQHSIQTLAVQALRSADLAFTNQTNKDLDQIVTTYSPELNSKNITKKTQSEIYSLAISAANQYIAILSLIKSGAVSGGIIKSSQLNSRIQGCEQRIKALQQISSSKDILDSVSNFYAIARSLNIARGYLQEEEAVNTLLNAMPHDMRFINMGTIQVGGKLLQGGADIAGFSKDLASQIQISWIQSPIGAGQQKGTKYTGSLLEFLDTQEYMRGTCTFYITEDVYVTMMENSILAIQSKATGTKTKHIKMEEDVSLFEKSKGYTSDGKTSFPSIAFTLKQYQSQYSRALEKMRHLYELSALENKGKSNYKHADTQYRMLLNMQLSKMLPWIMKHNDYILTPKFGLISLVDLFRQNLSAYFYYGRRGGGLRALDITNLENLSQDIYLYAP